MPHDDFEIEPVRGLPELPPEGEHILWQGSPNWWQLSWESLSLPWVAGYFVFLAAWRFVSVIDLMPVGQALGASVPFLILGGIVLALLMLVGLIQARSTVYTVTNRRVAMRIGAALNVTLNLPYTQIRNAELALRRNGTGTIAFETMGDLRMSYLVCWPHVRPWVMRRTQPALRCIPDAERVAGMIAEAAQARVSMPQVARSAGPADSAAVAAE
ncbi:photosynthetic complex putative assembly protein PuhB [Aestuariicoccus sp. MJ-SS9]|uniref:photosynthetic complex putative assembly protein PuhB n=1 Tax=Aestuariicoccus sp. MJ-SS9 TaxID=3079855 RepID=UPI002912A7FF|nr:photosynthetic complex putative assembly protein PuhB [Aestuariicoccus sp. MJ-SS9]MDU8910961.1 photosynthetic complex putative assembly protein PuhB [Aestuariicoccus sp. MJ-SS9]